MTSLESINLPFGGGRSGETLLTERSRRRYTYPARIPFAIDFNWPEMTALGELRNLGAIRVMGARPARVQYCIEAETRTTVRGAGGSKVIVSTQACDGAARPALSTEALVERPAESDPLLKAMMSQHPLDWMRSLLHGVGSAAWTAMARQAQVWPDKLDKLLEAWRELSGGAEHAIWRCWDNGQAFRELREWAMWLSNGMSSSEIGARVRSALEESVHWAASPTAEWLEASAGLPLCLIDAPAAGHRLQDAGTLLRQLLGYGLNDDVLRALREMADLSMAHERLSSASAVHIQEKQRHRRALERVCREIYAEVQAALAAVATADLARMLEGAGENWPMAEASFDLSVPGCDEKLQAALAGDLSAYETSDRGVRASPSLLALSVVRPLTICVSLPLVSFRRAPRMIAELDKSDVVQLPAGRVEVRLREPREHPLCDSTLSVLERTAHAPFRATSREPGSAEMELACEECFTLTGSEPKLLVKRLLDWHGLPGELPSTPARMSLRLSIPTGWSEIWHELPHSRDDFFLPVFTEVSTTIQQSMRRWLPHMALKSLARYGEPSEALPVLAYACSAPCCGKVKDGFTQARRGAAGLRAALYSGADEFQQILEIVHGELKSSGYRHCRNYDPSKWRAILVAIYRQRHPFSRLLEADSLFVEEVLHLSDGARELYGLTDSPKFAARMLLKSVESSRTGLGRRFDRLLAGRGSGLMPAVLWIEATAAACRAMGGDARVAASLTIHHESGCEIRHNDAALGRR